MKPHAPSLRLIGRRLAIAAVPLAAAAALVGPATGTAHAMEPGPANCASLLSAAYDSWDESDIWAFEAEQAWAQDDILSWAADNALSNSYEQTGDHYYGLFQAARC